MVNQDCIFWIFPITRNHTTNGKAYITFVEYVQRVLKNAKVSICYLLKKMILKGLKLASTSH